MELDLVLGAPSSTRSRLIGGGKVTRQDLINFCFHLEQLASAGVPVMEGLADLRESVENPRFREVVSGMIESIEGGRNQSARRIARGSRIPCHTPRGTRRADWKGAPRAGPPPLAA